MRRTLGIVVALIVAGVLSSAQTRSKTLDIYVVDTEGGKAGGPPPGGRPGGPGGGRGGHTGPANLIKVSAQADGTFSVTNTRNQFTKTYRAEQR